MKHSAKQEAVLVVRGMVETDFEHGKPEHDTAIEAIADWIENGDDDAQEALSLLGEEEAADIYRDHARTFDSSFDEQDSAPSIEDDDFVLQDGDRFSGGIDVFRGGRKFGNYEDKRDALRAIEKRMERDQFFPNIWYVNERGNTDLLDGNGNIVRSWV
jgi:hypothetical protein